MTKLLTGHTYLLNYQVYTTSEKDSWGGMIEFTAERDYDSVDEFMKKELKDMKQALCDHHKHNSSDTPSPHQIDCFWLFASPKIDVDNEFAILQASPESFQAAIKAYGVKDFLEETFGAEEDVDEKEVLECMYEYMKQKLHLNHLIGCGFYNKHPKRCSHYSAQSVERVANNLFSHIGVEIDTTKGTVKGWDLNNQKKQKNKNLFH